MNLGSLLLLSVLSFGVDPSTLLSSKALRPWRPSADQATASVNTSELPRVVPACSGTDIMPAHPQGTTKLYHVYETASFDHFKLAAGEPGCRVGSKGKNKKGISSCLAPDLLKHVILSDTYVDSCGNFYRGFWELYFLKSEEDMMTLVSKGRSLRQKPGSSIRGDLEMGPPHAVPLSEFIFFTPLFDGDLEKIQYSLSR